MQAGKQTVGDLGEFALIQRLLGTLPAGDGRLIVGPGDDAAVWRTGDSYTIATTDTMVAGVHFLPDAVPWRDVGWKALACNISDIAAMGGAPSIALVTLQMPASTEVESVDALYDGLHECAQAYRVTIAGGDIVSADDFAITIALAGEPVLNEQREPLLLRRDAAKAGDVIAVSGPLGGSAAGLRLLCSPGGPPVVDDGMRSALIARHMRPRPRVEVGNMAVRAGVRCGIDISDGLVRDLRHICEASGVDAEVRFDDIPLEPGLSDVLPRDARMLAATGGEDYELVVVGGAGALRIADEALRRDGKTPALAIIGRMTGAGEGAVNVIDATGAPVALDQPGWEHLSSKAAP